MREKDGRVLETVWPLLSCSLAPPTAHPYSPLSPLQSLQGAWVSLLSMMGCISLKCFSCMHVHIITATSFTLGKGGHRESLWRSDRTRCSCYQGCISWSVLAACTACVHILNVNPYNPYNRERRQRGKKTGVLSYPFQRLLSPFSNNEHHSMHSIITIPIEHLREGADIHHRLCSEFPRVFTQTKTASGTDCC